MFDARPGAGVASLREAHLRALPAPSSRKPLDRKMKVLVIIKYNNCLPVVSIIFVRGTQQIDAEAPHQPNIPAHFIVFRLFPPNLWTALRGDPAIAITLSVAAFMCK